MAITPGTWGAASSGSPITVALTNPAGSGSRYFLGKLSIEVRGTEPTSIACTFGGVAATLVTGSPSQNPTGGTIRVYWYYLLDADLPAAGAQNAVMTLSGGSDYSARFAAVVHDGVTQAAPTYYENAVDPVETAVTIGSIAYAAGDYAAIGASNSDSTSTFTWSASWDEREDSADFVSEFRSGLADRVYSGTGTDSVTATISAGTRIAAAVVLLSAAVSGPTIDTQPTAQTAVINNSSTPTATFTVAATTSGGALTQQWQLEDSVGSGTYTNITNGGIYAGATSTSLVITPTTKTGLTGLRVRCNVTDSNGTTTTNAVALTVYTGFQFTSATTGVTVNGVATVDWTDDRPGAALGNGGFVKGIATANGVRSLNSQRPT